MNINSKKYDTPDERRDGLFAFVWSLITSVVIMTICSKSSFLYPFNLWDDANSYFTVGKSMTSGMVPYRDLFDQKGIFQYSIYMVASLISRTTFLGVYVMEIIACAMALFAAFRIMQLYLRSVSMPYILTPVVGMIIYTSKCFYWGGSAEEFLFPFIMWGMYISLRHFRENYPEPMRYKWVLAGGILAGFVFHIKFNSLGFFFAWMAMVFFADIIGAKAVKKAFVSCVVFLTGMATTFIPGLIYFGINNAIFDWGRVYIYENVFGYSKKLTFGERIACIYDKMTDHMYDNKLVYLTIFIGALYFTVALVFSFVPEDKYKIIKRDIVVIPLKVVEYVNIAMLLGFLILIIFIGGVSITYYPFPINGFVVFGAIAIGYMLEGLYLKLRRVGFKDELTRLTSAVMLSMLLITGITEYCISPNVPYMKYAKDDLWLYHFRDYIKASGIENPKIINENGFDAGLYTVTDTLPVCYFFQTQTVNEESMQKVLEEQKRFTHEKIVDFVISVRIPAEGVDDYDLVLQEDYITPDEETTYYLYQKKAE
ncbi:MAG: hypothetical protein J5504_05075 [Butyrivibrio sp.]|nr:hypothetical protein [Butyrivibrio sp.]